MVKKGFLKTVEIFLVIVATTVFAFVLIPQEAINPVTKAPIIISPHMHNSQFRSMITNVSGCSTNVAGLEPYVPNNLNYILCVNQTATNLPDQEIDIESYFYVGNITSSQFSIIRLYTYSK